MRNERQVSKDLGNIELVESDLCLCQNFHTVEMFYISSYLQFAKRIF